MYRVPFEGDENVLNLIVVMVAQRCEYTENHQIVYLEWVM